MPETSTDRDGHDTDSQVSGSEADTKDTALSHVSKASHAIGKAAGNKKTNKKARNR